MVSIPVHPSYNRLYKKLCDRGRVHDKLSNRPLIGYTMESLRAGCMISYLIRHLIGYIMESHRVSTSLHPSSNGVYDKLSFRDIVHDKLCNRGMLHDKLSNMVSNRVYNGIS